MHEKNKHNNTMSWIRSPKRVLIFIFVVFILGNSTYSGQWRRGVPVTTILPVGDNQGIQLVSEDVSLFLDDVFATVSATYRLKNTSDKKVSLKAGMWRYGDNYLNGIIVTLNKLIFSVEFDSQVQEDFEQQIIPKKLNKFFQNKAIPLCQNSIQLIQQSDSLWQVTDKNQIYIFRKERNDLNIFKIKQFLFESDFNIYLDQKYDSLEMIEVNNQSFYEGPDYLFTLDFDPNEQIIVEVYCRALMQTNESNEISYIYEAKYGKQWFNALDKVTIRAFPPAKKIWTLLGAIPPGYQLIGNALVWENNKQIRNSYCSAKYK